MVFEYVSRYVVRHPRSVRLCLRRVSKESTNKLRVSTLRHFKASSLIIGPPRHCVRVLFVCNNVSMRLHPRNLRNHRIHLTTSATPTSQNQKSTKASPHMSTASATPEEKKFEFAKRCRNREACHIGDFIRRIYCQRPLTNYSRAVRCCIEACRSDGMGFETQRHGEGARESAWIFCEKGGW